MRHRSLAATLAGLLLATAATSTAFAAPAPDGFSRRGALPISLGDTESLDASSATGTLRVDAACTPDTQVHGHTVWWKLTATVSTLVIADANGSAHDTVLQLYDKGKKIACDDSSGGGYAARLAFVAQAGKTYYFGVAAREAGPAAGLAQLALIEDPGSLVAVVGAPTDTNACAVTVSGSDLLAGSDIYYNHPSNVLGLPVAGDGTFLKVSSFAEGPVTFYGTTAQNQPISTGEVVVFCH